VALSTRRKAVAGTLAAIVLAAGGFVGYRLLTKKPGEDIIPNPFNGDDQPVTCPLTGLDPDDDVPNRPALAIKVENNPDARPQAGLAEADIVYEEEAEGGITRFMAIYQCAHSERIGPVRSARLVDPKILDQFGRPLFAFAGGAPSVRNFIDDFRGIHALIFGAAFENDPFVEDPNRPVPHHVFTSTRALYRAAGDRGRGNLPGPVLTYDDEAPRGKRAREIHAQFNPTVADVIWRYDRGSGEYLRFHGEEAHTLEDGSQVATTNVIVQIVERLPTEIVDPAGNAVFDFEVLGSGKAVVFRGGKAIKGRWERGSQEEVTRLVTRQGDEIPLAPGTTWVELYPSDAPKLEF
jgi:hypothetical protein